MEQARHFYQVHRFLNRHTCHEIRPTTRHYNERQYLASLSFVWVGRYQQRHSVRRQSLHDGFAPPATSMRHVNHSQPDSATRTQSFVCAGLLSDRPPRFKGPCLPSSSLTCLSGSMLSPGLTATETVLTLLRVVAAWTQICTPYTGRDPGRRSHRRQRRRLRPQCVQQRLLQPQHHDPRRAPPADPGQAAAAEDRAGRAQQVRRQGKHEADPTTCQGPP